MLAQHFNRLLEEVSNRQTLVRNYLFDERNRLRFAHQHLEDAVYSYLNAGGKSLRPAVVMFACGATGGSEESAIPAAAAIELYHTFTLVHDDIIDRDSLRRGVPTVHTEFTQRGIDQLGFDADQAQHYGTTIAILAGDLQQGWAAALLPDLYYTYGIPAELALFLVRQLFQYTQVALINGETLDVMQAETPIESLNEAEVLAMLQKKTGALYEFAGYAGAAIGLKKTDFDHPLVQAVGGFASKCGLAFQLQDDILGVLGNTKQLGKQVGADIREGKRTVILLHSYQNMSPGERAFCSSVLGNPDASQEEINNLIDLLDRRGGIDHARNLAETYVSEALELLEALPESESRSLLQSWAEYITARDR